MKKFIQGYTYVIGLYLMYHFLYGSLYASDGLSHNSEMIHNYSKFLQYGGYITFAYIIGYILYFIFSRTLDELDNRLTNNRK